MSVQNRYSLADRRHETTLAWCEQQQIAFLPWYPMAGGKLLRGGLSAAQLLAPIAARNSVSVAQLSLAWLLRRSPVLLPIPGTVNVSHLEENVAAASLQLSDADWAEIEAEARS